VNGWLIWGAGVVCGVIWVLGVRAWHAMHGRPRHAPHADTILAEWCRHMSLTVLTVSGAVFSTTFGELAASDDPSFRTWNVPLQVTVWSDQADDVLTEDVRQSVARGEA
jgi:hypothetical protein